MSSTPAVRAPSHPTRPARRSNGRRVWGRPADNPVGGWYGIKNGLRGRYGNYVPPVLEVLGLAEVEHNASNSRMRGRAAP